MHGAVIGRDHHGDVTIAVTIGDVLAYLKDEIDKTIDTEGKKTLLVKLSELSKHPIVVGLSSTVISAVAKSVTG